MTRILISVRSLDEFKTAVDAGVSVIDIKEPTRGSLGRADLSTIRQIANAAPNTITLSVALGELMEADQRLHASLPDRIDFIKVGLAGCLKVTRWREKWRTQLACLPEKTRAVAVAYADAGEAASPPIGDVIQTGYELGCNAFLIDTYRKDTGNLLTHLSIPEMTKFVTRVRTHGMLVALAGSLGAEAINSLCELEPDLLAFRSAACDGRRASAISRDAILLLRETLTLQKNLMKGNRISHPSENLLGTPQND